MQQRARVVLLLHCGVGIMCQVLEHCERCSGSFLTNWAFDEVGFQAWIICSIWMKASTERLWNGTDGGKQKCWEQNLSLRRLACYSLKGNCLGKQSAWIQTELAFTLAKNATKPNPFEIIPLQTTRKENNWKTEEALERAVVTVETERIKGSNPWCLWWWWSVHVCAVTGRWLNVWAMARQKFEILSK